MTRKTKKKSTLYEYLAPLLASGSDKEIAEAKKAYWKVYRKEYKQQYAKTHTCFKIFFTPSERALLSKAAKMRGISTTNFVKQSALTQSSKKNLVDKIIIGNVREALALTYSHVEALLEEHIQADISNKALDQLAHLEDTILKLLEYAPSTTP